MIRVPPSCRRATPRSGIVYLLALLVVLVVSGVAMAMGQGTGAHLRLEQQAIAQAQCEAAALGLLRAVCNDLEEALTSGLLPQLQTVNAAGEVIGDCTVVLVGRDPAGLQSRYGLIPEAGRLDINAMADTTVSAPHRDVLATALSTMPGMDITIVAAICDWCDADDTPDSRGGAERSDGAYTGAAVPYAPRNGAIQGLEELRLVRGVTDALYFGEDRNASGKLDPGEDDNADGLLTLGLRDLCTLDAREPALVNGTARAAFVNPRTGALDIQLLTQALDVHFAKQRAARLVAEVQAALGRGSQIMTSRLQLFSLMPDLTEEEGDALWPALQGPEGRVGLVDAWSANNQLLEALVGVQVAQAIIAARPATMPTGPKWLVDALGAANCAKYGYLLTVGSYQFRADLLAVRNDGAGWVRLEAVIDCLNGNAASVVSLRHTSTLGWPFPLATPELIRRSQPADVAGFLATGQP